MSEEKFQNPDRLKTCCNPLRTNEGKTGWTRKKKGILAVQIFMIFRIRLVASQSIQRPARLQVVKLLLTTFSVTIMASYVENVLAQLRAAESDCKVSIVRGIPQNPSFNVAQLEDLIDNFEVRDDDVFIVTYVKAGTTWTQQIVHLLLREGEAGGFYGESIPWLEAVTSEVLNPREAPTWNRAKIDNAPSPRYFKCHANLQHVPGNPFSKNKRIKIIYVARNPKDTVVSLYNHAKSKPEFSYTGTFDKFCENFLAGKTENGDWFDHVLEWHQQCLANPDTHLFLKYEDMYANTPAAIEKIASFLDIPYTQEIVGKVAQNATIDEMRAKASIGLNHLRQGGYGNWRRSFSVALSEFFDDVYEHRMRNANGLTFNFGPNSRGVDVIF